MYGVFKKEQEKLKKRLLAMSAMVEESLLRAVRAFEQNDALAARKIIDGDEAIDELEVEIEEECLKVLALHQPVAVDLRFLAAILRINNDLERIADLAVNICIQTQHDPPMQCAFDISRIASRARAMLKKSLDAFVNLDLDLAREVCRLDDEVDALNAENTDLAIQAIEQNPACVRRMLQALRVSRNLERVADLATNIAEVVIYITRGEIVRHKQNY